MLADSLRRSIAGRARSDARDTVVIENRYRRVAGGASRRNPIFSRCIRFTAAKPSLSPRRGISGEGPQADAMVTNVRETSRSVSSPPTAHRCCSPTPQAHVIGAAHAGWKRRTILGVTDSAIAAMEAARCKAAQRIVAAIESRASARNELRRSARNFAIDSAETVEPCARFFVPSDKPGHFRFALEDYVVIAACEAPRIRDRWSASHTAPMRARAEFFSYRRATHRGEKETMGDRKFRQSC